MTDGKEILKKLRQGMGGKKIKKDQILILLLVGMLFLVIAMPVEKKKSGQDTTFLPDESAGKEGLDEISQEEYIRAQESRLAELLSRMEGAGEVSVMITLSSSAERIVEKDMEESKETVTEADSQGGSRTTQNVQSKDTSIYDGDNTNEQSPYISKELSPRVEGVVVIAEGGDDAVVVKNITEAVQALFGIDTHKIRIVKGRREA